MANLLFEMPLPSLAEREVMQKWNQDGVEWGRWRKTCKTLGASSISKILHLDVFAPLSTHIEKMIFGREPPRDPDERNVYLHIGHYCEHWILEKTLEILKTFYHPGCGASCTKVRVSSAGVIFNETPGFHFQHASPDGLLEGTCPHPFVFPGNVVVPAEEILLEAKCYIRPKPAEKKGKVSDDYFCQAQQQMETCLTQTQLKNSAFFSKRRYTILTALVLPTKTASCNREMVKLFTVDGFKMELTLIPYSPQFIKWKNDSLLYLKESLESGQDSFSFAYRKGHQSRFSSARECMKYLGDFGVFIPELFPIREFSLDEGGKLRAVRDLGEK